MVSTGVRSSFESLELMVSRWYGCLITISRGYIKVVVRYKCHHFLIFERFLLAIYWLKALNTTDFQERVSHLLPLIIPISIYSLMFLHFEIEITSEAEGIV